MKKRIATLLTIGAAVSSLASSSKPADNLLTTPKTYVLVHGAWQAPYVWSSVKADLIGKGNKVIVVELPGHGADTAAAYTLSLDVYREKVIEAISAVQERVVLVGHSMAGMVISVVAEKVPSKITKLVYICAFLPADGQALIELANSDSASKLGPVLTESPDKLTLDIKIDSLAALFISDGNPAVKQQVRDNYRAEPAIPFINKVKLTKENFGVVDKAYIKTLHDVVISPGLQDKMIAAAGIRSVYAINTSHSPFLAQPHALSELLLTIGKE